jgi:hypothetical protein
MFTLPARSRVRKTRPTKGQLDFLSDAPILDEPERWLPVPNWPFYEVSDLGGMRCWMRRGPYGTMMDTPRILKPSRMKSGYFQVEGSSTGGKRRVNLVHRLVLLAFVGPPPEGRPVCRHLDGDPSNNRLSNLVWGTQLENAADRLRHGSIKPRVDEPYIPFYFSDPFIPIEAIIPVEVWKTLDKYPGYEVSNRGQVGSYWRSGDVVISAETHRILKPRHGKGHYGSVIMKNLDGRKNTRDVHRLVIEAFSAQGNTSLDCRHMDGDRTNNHIANLRWSTRIENARDRILHGTQFRGSSVPTSKLNEEKVGEIRRRFANGEVIARLAEEYDVTSPTISRIVRRWIWKHVA